MRVLHVVDSIIPQAGTMAVALRALLAPLASRDVDGSVLTQTDARELEKHQEDIGGHFILTADEMGSSWADYDLIHIHGWGYETARHAARSARRRNVPYLIAPLGSLTEDPFRRTSVRDRWRRYWSETSELRSAARIGAINEFERASLQNREWGRAVEILPVGVDFDRYAAASESGAGPGQRPESGRILLVLGPVDPLWGLVPLLTAMAESGAAADGWRVVFAGADAGGWRRQLEAAIRRKGAENRVTFTPAADEHTQQVWLGRAEALACVALHPNCPVAVVQGLAAGLPVLATNAIVPGDAGDLVIGCDPSREGIRAGVETLLAMPEQQRRAHGLRNRDVARSRLDARVVADRWVEWYERLIPTGAIASRSCSVGR